MTNRSNVHLDGAGFVASILCAIHCAALPFILSFLPLIGLEVLANRWVEISFTAISVLISMLSFVPDYRKNHHNKNPLTLLGLGLMIIISTHYFLPTGFEFVFVPIGALCIALAHFFNWKLSRKHNAHLKAPQCPLFKKEDVPAK